MVEYRVDPDGVVGVAGTLSAAADSGPSEFLPSLSGCGSASAETIVDDDGRAFSSAWGSARDAVMQLAVGGVQAAETYRQAESEVAAVSQSAGSSLSGADE